MKEKRVQDDSQSLRCGCHSLVGERETEQGEDRCIVAIEKNGEACKFFTNSEEMKNILAQVREMPDGFPFETIIKSETFGKGRTKYVFT